ncbi:LysR family transcriptional regulator [Ectobacillus panaciterrae]|uniref:LysR family transcriptional regulator n=1 Tax=Ectobacillus panaciterrae TaxID=363872 RepID=UPI0003F7EF8D|nr:LysR family transcriptional regulator [Ectobacillus panaciterrae]
MRIEQLLYLIEIVKTGSISTASELLNISQSSLKHAVLKIEQELNCTLFIRSKNIMKLTEEGERVILKMQEVLNKWDEVKEAARVQQQEVRGSLSISVVPDLCRSIIPKTVAAFKSNFPNVKIELRESELYEIKKDVLNQKVDLGLVGVPFTYLENDHELISRHFLSSSIMACVGKSSDLVKRDKISMTEIIKHPIVAFLTNHGMDHYLYQILRKYGDPNILLRSESHEATKYLIAEGEAIGFYSALSLHFDPFIKSKEIMPIPVEDENLRVSFCWIRNKNHYFSHVGREFLKELQIQASYYKDSSNVIMNPALV